MSESIIHDPLWEFGAFKATLQLLFMNDDLVTRLVMPELDDSNFSYEQNWKGVLILLISMGNHVKLLW